MEGTTRRGFLGQAAGFAAAFLGAPRTAESNMKVHIDRIETLPVVYPVAGRFKFFETRAGLPTGRPTVFVKVTADDGTVGWGQSVPSPRWSYETLETVATTIDRYLAPDLIGKDPFDTGEIQRSLESFIAPSFSTGQPICKAGIDLALFDLTGQLLKRTAGERWGRRGRDRIPLSWTLNPRELKEIDGLIEQGRERGYRNFNVKVAPDPVFDLELCRRVKRLVPDGFLWVDANGGYDEATALDVAPKLADMGVAVFEQPLRPNRLRGYQRLRRQGALPIILDEGVVHSSDLEEFVALEMLDGVAMKHARCGGLTEARRQIEILEREELMFLGSGLSDPDVSLAAALLLFGAYDLRYPAALNGPQFLGTSFLKDPFEVVGGQLAVPDGPGLGVEVDEERVRAHRVKVL